MKPITWSDVIAESEALARGERAVEPEVGDRLDHPVLGPLDVVAVDASRIDVRDRTRRLRKLVREALEFRLHGEKGGRRVLKVKPKTAR
jgi:hypothetical protein